MDVEKVVRENIEPLVHMSLATVRDNKPWVCEVHFVYDDDLNLYFSSLKSRRHSQEIGDNAHVAGNIVRQYNLGDKILGVYFEGTAKLLKTDEEQRAAFECFKARMNARDEMMEEAKHEDGHQFYKINVDNWYVFGKFDQPSGQKYKLEWNGGKR